MSWRALFLLCALLALPAQALPRSLLASDPLWQLAGQGEMRWFGLRLYGAELWLQGPRFDPKQAHALKLTYARSFSGERLAASSVEEMRRVGERDEARLARWQAQMAAIFPDVREGDSLTGVFLPGQGARFYLGEQLRGEIADADFARAFAGIWLDERTREPALRARLLGGS